MNCSAGSWEEDNHSNLTCGMLPLVEQHVEEQTSYWILYNNLAKSLPAILVALVFGGLSDFYARRKPFILLPALGGAVNALLVLVLWYSHTTSLPAYLVGSLLAGLLGSTSVFNFAVYSYIADISTPSKRTVKVGVLESMTYFGATISSAVGGIWVQKQGFAPPFWSILVCQLAVVVYVLVALPSSRPITRTSGREGYAPVSADQSIRAHCSCIVVAVGENFLSFVKLLFTSLDMSLMMITFLIVEINFMAISDIVVVYALGRPLCWVPRLVGYYLAGKVLMNGVASILVLPLLSWCGLSDAVIILFGLLSGMASLVIMGSARVTWVMMLGKS